MKNELDYEESAFEDFRRRTTIKMENENI